MAWFGEGFSSLKGQITNLTKEVATNVVGINLNDNSRSPNEDEDDCAVPSYNLQNAHVEKLQAHCKSQDEEIAQLRGDNERLRKLLARQTPRDRRVSEEATLECQDAAAAAALPLVPLDELGTDSFLGQDQVPKDAKADEEMSSLRSRLRKTFQEKVLMEQSCSRLEKEVALLTRQVAEDRLLAQAGRQAEAASRSSNISNQSCQTEVSSCPPSGSQDLASLVHDNEQLQQEKVQLRAELTRLARAVQELESQVAFSQDENSNLSTGMEELDIQHQQAIEEIVVQKDTTQKRYELLLAEFEELKDKYEETLESSKKQSVKRDSRNVIHCESQTDDDVPCADKSQILVNISEEIKSMITTEIPEKYFETGKENANGLETVAAVEKMLSHTLSRVEASEGKIRDLLRELRSKEEEVQEIEDENKTLRIKIEEIKEQCATLPIIAENNEDIEGMENRIMALENERSILREVRSNLEVEHNNSRSEIETLIRRLQSTEAMIRNQDNLQTEISKYKESEKELLRKFEVSETAREEALLVVSKLKANLKDQDKMITELKENKTQLDTLLAENSVQQIELAKSSELELLYQAAVDDLKQEKLIITQKDAEKESLIDEIKNLKGVKEELNEQLQESKNAISRLEVEITELNKATSALKESSERELAELMNKIKSEENLVKYSEDSLEDLRKKLDEFQRKEDGHQKFIDQLNYESDMKLRDLKSINTCLTQKCVKYEKEIFDLSEKSDSLKIEMDSKDRKMCEMILEKSISDKELDTVKIEKDVLEKQLTEVKALASDKEKALFVELKNILGSSAMSTQQQTISISDVISDIASKFECMEQDKSQLHSSNASLTENVNRLLAEVNDKSDCLSKLSAQVETLNAEKHSLEDRLRNLRETVSTGNQTDQPDSPEISQENFTELKKKLEERESQCQDLENNYKKLLMSSDQSLKHVNEQLRLLHNERQQLIETVQTKHAESVKYHAEIQRLCAELSKVEEQKVDTATQLQKQIEEKDDQLASLQASSDRQVAALNEQLHTLQNQLDYVSQLLRVTDRQEAEGQPASDSPSTKNQSSKAELVEKEATRVDELYESLQQEQLRNKYLQDEVSDQHEKEAALVRELGRLREHLVAVEDNYTQEMVRAEHQVAELGQRLGAAEERAKTSTTAYTSASIRANQQVESMGGQMRQLMEHKEKLASQLALAEDKLHKQAAALTNLQAVLEHFQRDKERDVAMENERIRQNLEKANNKNSDLLNEMKALQLQLKEAKEGLSAASRLTEQLDQKTHAITELKKEVAELTEKLKKADERIHAASVSVEGKVDRCLVRNLVVGYLSAAPASQPQALGIIGTVLDFTPEDRLRSGLDPGAKGSIKQQSLSEAFVQFLESESQPQPHLRLALQQGAQDSKSRKSSVTEVGLAPARRTSGSVLKDVLRQDL